MKIRQKGSVLIVSLVLLLVLTLVGVTAMNMTSLEERMSGNYRDHQMAFQAAEATLVEAEAWIESTGLQMQDFYSGCGTTNCFKSACTNGLCFDGTFPPSASAVDNCELGTAKPWETKTNWTSTAKHKKADSLTGAATQGRFMIEFRCFVVKDPTAPSPDPKNFVEWTPFFRVTALANGGTGDSQVMLQSTYKLINF